MQTIKIMQEIPLNRLANVLCSALDPGHEAISYWGEVRDKTEPTEWTYRPPEAEAGDRQVYRHYYPLNEGGVLYIRDNEGEKKHYKLDYKAVLKGLKLMAKNYPKHFADILSKTDDSCTADVLVQLALFGDIIYG